VQPNVEAAPPFALFKGWGDHNRQVETAMCVRVAALIFVAFSACAKSSAAQSEFCQPSAEIQQQLKQATTTMASADSFDQRIVPLQKLRAQHPQNLFVHEAYEDWVQQYGIEGHLRALTSEYQVLAAEHPQPEALTYRYLYARSTIGRNTPATVLELTAIAEEHPDFAPAHKSLAEIYASDEFGDPAREKAERERFLQLCPGSVLAKLPPGLPSPSSQLDEAAKFLASGGDPEQVLLMAEKSVRDDEWRLQRIRPFDWYSVDFKRAAQRELQASYWKMWEIEVRCAWKNGQTEKADQLLAQLKQRAAALGIKSDPLYQTALSTLTRLDADGKGTRQ
jgi:hypothetical protein